MDFSLTDDRRMLSDSLGRFLADTLPMDRRNAVAYAVPFHDPEVWSGLSELGLWAALVSEDKGGFGGAGADIAVVFEALGAVLCPEPALGVAMAGALLPAGDPLLDGLLDGSVKVAVATDMDAEIAVADAALTGRVSVIYGGQAADTILVEADGAVFAVDTAAAQITPYGLVDGGGAADLFLDATPARRIDGAQPALGRQAGLVALCAEAVGVMARLVEITLDYLKTRQQFGKPIGANQALQHRMVDLTVELEQARSITILAANSMGGPEGALHTAMAKSLIGRVGKLIAEEAIQLHGGIAVTWDYEVSHFAKRLTMIDHQLGDQDDHLDAVIALQG